MELQIQHIIGYLPWGLKVQYNGILNGEELKEHRKKLVSEAWLSSNRNVNPPQELHGLKIGFVKGVSFWNCGLTYHVGIKSKGLKKIYSLMDLKPLLKPMTKEVLEEVFEGVTNIGWDMELYPKWIIDKFHKHHVDYQDLIGKGLAVNILTLKAK